MAIFPCPPRGPCPAFSAISNALDTELAEDTEQDSHIAAMVHTGRRLGSQDGLIPMLEFRLQPEG